MAVSSHYGVGPNGSRAAAALLRPLESSCAPSPSGAPWRRRCSPTPEFFVLEEEEDGALIAFSSFLQGPLCLFSDPV
jgi:hypothetical protein